MRTGVTGRVRVAAAVLATLSALSVVAAAGPAAADDGDPLFIGWSAALSGFSVGYEPSSENDCKAGRIQCVDNLIREMERRFDPLVSTCDHDAMFALTYLRTTQEYREAAAAGTFFYDTGFVNHQDVVFAEMYFDAFDAWHDGDLAATPPAWQVAFDAADDRAVTGTGNLLLGMSAHVNRDLPFALAAIGLVRPDGRSRKDDHDKVNEFLNRVMEPLLAEAAARLDPTVDDGNLPFTTLDETLLLQLLASWREGAWRNAERLVMAPDDAARAAVAASIEDEARLIGESIAAQTAYGPLDGLLGRRAARDTFCAANHG